MTGGVAHKRARASGGGAEAQVRTSHWVVAWAGPMTAARQAPPPARGDLRGGGGGERAGLRRRLAGGFPPLGPLRPGRSGSDAVSDGLGVGEPPAALGGPGGAQAASLGKGGGWAEPAGPRPVLRRAHVRQRPVGAENLQFPAANPVFFNLTPPLGSLSPRPLREPRISGHLIPIFCSLNPVFPA